MRALEQYHDCEASDSPVGFADLRRSVRITMMNDNTYSMIQECCERFVASRRPDGGLTITINVCPRFSNLWLVKLNGLETDDHEIHEYEHQ
jgi:hypothetical protein